MPRMLPRRPAAPQPAAAIGISSGAPRKCRPHRRRRPGGDRPAVRRHRPDRWRCRRRRSVRRTAREARRRHRDRDRLGEHLRVPAATGRRARRIRSRTGGPGADTGSRRRDRGHGPIRHRDRRGRTRRTAGTDLHDRGRPQPSRRRARNRRQRSRTGRLGSDHRRDPYGKITVPIAATFPIEQIHDAVARQAGGTSMARSWSRCDRALAAGGQQRRAASLYKRAVRWPRNQWSVQCERWWRADAPEVPPCRYFGTRESNMASQSFEKCP